MDRLNTNAFKEFQGRREAWIERLSGRIRVKDLEKLLVAGNMNRELRHPRWVRRRLGPMLELTRIDSAQQWGTMP